MALNNRVSEKSTDQLDRLLIWDVEEPLEEKRGKTALWRSFSDGVSNNLVSIPALVEKNADALKQRYLSWIYNLGVSKIQGSRLVDHLELRPGLSYWWMSLSAQKCNYSRSSQISNALRLMAFEGWVSEQTLTHVKLVSSSEPLSICIQSWCLSKGITFEWQRMPTETAKASWFRRIYRSLPVKINALIWLVHYLVTRWPLKGVGLKEWAKSKGEVAFVSYLYNLVPNALEAGKFESRYWAHLPDSLQRDDCKTNWLHMYVKGSLTPTRAATVIRQFNALDQGGQVHVTLDTFLGLRVIFRALSDWRLLHRAGTKFQNISITQPNASINVWPLFEDDWHQSLYGVEALSNLINLNLYEAALSALPAQRTGVYLQENQGWEPSLVHAWNVAGHGRLIGSPNASVRFWDLRYFFDQRSYHRNTKNNLPLPDMVAINGSAARRTYLNGNYPESQLIEVEALRYLSLADYSIGATKIPRPKGTSLTVLVMGDYLSHNTKLQMRLLEQAATLLPKDTAFVVKPHPNCPVNPADYPEFQMTVTMDPLSSLLTKCDVACSSSLTAASLDAYCTGVPVISVLDPSQLNMSPLRGCVGAVFVCTAEELAIALTDRKPLNPDQNTFFRLNPKLASWKRLLLEKS